MRYLVTVYRANGLLDEHPHENPPTLADLQGYVGGYIEAVPMEYYLETNHWFLEEHDLKNIDSVWCNEEGLLQNPVEINRHFEQAVWGTRLVGDIAVVEKFKEDK